MKRNSKGRNVLVLVISLERSVNRIAFIEMDAYMPLLQALPLAQRLLAKEQLTILQKLPHPYLCRIDQVTGSDASLSVSCEYLRNMSYTLSWSDEELAKQFLGVVAALSMIQTKVRNTQGIAHGRLSLAALYLDYEGRKVKVVGFGAYNSDPGLFASACSQLPLQYHSPEIKQGLGFNPFKADMWALGVCFLQLGTRQDLTGRETLKEVVSKAASLGPLLGSLLRLVLTAERDRPDFLQFKACSGYCKRCWDNLDQEQTLCGRCPQGSRSRNPLAIQPLYPEQVNLAQVADSHTVLQKYRLVNQESSPEPAKCSKCKRPLTKVNEKEICLLCLARLPSAPIRSVVSNPQSGLLAADRPDSFEPQKPVLVTRAKKWDVPSDAPRGGPRGFPRPGQMTGREGQGPRICLECKEPLGRLPGNGEMYQGYGEICEECAVSMAINESKQA